MDSEITYLINHGIPFSTVHSADVALLIDFTSLNLNGEPSFKVDVKFRDAEHIGLYPDDEYEGELQETKYLEYYVIIPKSHCVQVPLRVNEFPGYPYYGPYTCRVLPPEN